MHRILFLCLFATAYAISDKDKDDTELSNYLSLGSSAKAAGSAAKWLFEQRESWGPFLPRAVVALSVAEGAGAHSLPKVEWGLLAKQLDVLVSIEVGGDAIREQPLTSSRLSHFLHALLATCQDPRRFPLGGLDLVKRLRERAERLTEKAPTLLYLALCMAGEATHADLSRLSRMYQQSTNRTDSQALQLLAMSCITSLPVFSSARPIFTAYVHEFATRFRTSLRKNTTDTYTKAMAIQALNSAGVSVDVSSLLADQKADGSFEGSLLATYHAIPALLDTSLLALRNARCPAQIKASTQNTDDLELESSPGGVVRVSLWVGDGADKDTHTVSVPTGANHTLLDLLRAASDKNEIFRFHYDDTASGARVYSLAGIPNDSERETSWQLYIQKSGKHERLHYIRNAGVDKVYPSPEDVVVFWYKRDTVL